MRHLLSALIFLAAFAAPTSAQTMKALVYNTNGDVVYGGTNILTFTNAQVRLSPVVLIGTNFASLAAGGNFVSMTDANGDTVFLANTNVVTFYDAIAFSSASNRATTRTNLGLEATWLTNTNVTNFRTAIGLGATNDVFFDDVQAVSFLVGDATNSQIAFEGNSAAATRTNLGLGQTNSVTFAGLTNNGDITINQTTATNGLLFIRRTNNEPFLGLANLLASNNTTLSNETLFRVGRAEATNQSAQFGFRIVRTNNGGEGFAVFSVFGYNALMMIGPSDRSRTNTSTNAGIEADIWTINQTNRVMTLRDTNTGALTMHQDLGFNAGLTNTTPTNTNTPAVWMRVWVGTNSYRVPLYQ
jgi:hypothetical protein